MEIQKYLEDWVKTYCEANGLDINKEKISEIVFNIVERLVQRGYEDKDDIKDDV